MKTNESILRSLGITTRKTRKIIPNGRHYADTRKAVKFLNEQYRSKYGKNKFIGFFPNLKNPNGVFYIVTSDFKLFFDDKKLPTYIKILNKKYIDTPIQFKHYYAIGVYGKIKDEEGLFII